MTTAYTNRRRHFGHSDTATLPPSISPWRRRFELAGIVKAHETLLGVELDAAGTLAYADALAQFLDSCQIEEIDDPLMRVDDANAKAMKEPVKAGYVNAIQVYPYSTGALYRLYASVNQVSDVALQQGEKLVSVSTGDTVRWIKRKLGERRERRAALRTRLEKWRGILS